MMNDIQLFRNPDFGEIRTLQIDNETWFVARDIATALGYAKPENAIAAHVDDEDKTTTSIQGRGSNYKSITTLINESGMYALIFGSKLENAKKFKHWVTSEVLPSIRRTGEYAPQRKSFTYNSTYNGQSVMTFAEIEAVSGIPQWYSRDFVLRKCKRNVDFLVLRGADLLRFKRENNFQRENVNALTIVSQRCLCKLYEVYKARSIAPPAKRIESKQQPSVKKRKTKPDPHEVAAYVSSLPQTKREKFIGAFVCALIGK